MSSSARRSRAGPRWPRCPCRCSRWVASAASGAGSSCRDRAGPNVPAVVVRAAVVLAGRLAGPAATRAGPRTARRRCPCSPGPCAAPVVGPPATASAATPRPSPREPRSERRVMRRREEISTSVRDLAAGLDPSSAPSPVLRNGSEESAPAYQTSRPYSFTPTVRRACVGVSPLRPNYVANETMRRPPALLATAHDPAGKPRLISSTHRQGRAGPAPARAQRPRHRHQFPNRPENTSSPA